MLIGALSAVLCPNWGYRDWGSIALINGYNPRFNFSFVLAVRQLRHDFVPFLADFALCHATCDTLYLVPLLVGFGC